MQVVEQFTEVELRKAVSGVPFWWHSIDLGHGVVTPGHKTVEIHRNELEAIRLPDLHGKSVLDIGAWDGFYSWTAERLGARRVVSLDHYAWAVDRSRVDELSIRWRNDGVPPVPFEMTDAWKPTELPGKRGYDLAHRVLKSKVECFVGNFIDVNFEELGGPFDVVLFLGVVYHMRHPLLALEKLAAATKEVAIIESEAMEYPGAPDLALCEFFERDELAGDFSNWWCPNEKALVGMCRAAGFRRVEVLRGPRRADSPAPSNVSVRASLRRAGGDILRQLGVKPPIPAPPPRDPRYWAYRAVVHAWK